jgi:predicted  nucleic acid-binding Zn-ribbon protein
MNTEQPQEKSPLDGVPTIEELLPEVQEQRRQERRAWNQQHPEKVKAYRARSRARPKNGEALMGYTNQNDLKKLKRAAQRLKRTAQELEDHIDKIMNRDKRGRTPDVRQ